MRPPLWEVNIMIKKYLLLKSMNQIVSTLNIELSYIFKWTYYVPADATDEDFETWAQNDESFNKISKAFIEIMKDYHYDGFFIDGEVCGIDA